MKLKLRQALLSFLQYVKKEWKESPVKTSLAAVGLLSMTGVGIWLHRYISIVLTKTEETNIPLLILSLVSLITVSFLLRANNKKPRLPYTIEYFPIGELKWKAKIFRKDYFELDSIPLCLKHNLLFLESPEGGFYCPEIIGYNCKNIIQKKDYDRIYNNAKSYIDREIRNGK